MTSFVLWCLSALRRASAGLHPVQQPVEGVPGQQERAKDEEDDEQSSQEASEVTAVEGHRQSDGNDHRYRAEERVTDRLSS